MESNTDKQMRDKLNGVEFPFDPKAWESMEAMLDEKKKRRGFIWWWWGGAAALLVTGFVAYGVLHQGRGNRAAGNTTQQLVAQNKQGPASKEQQVSSNELSAGGHETQGTDVPPAAGQAHERHTNNESAATLNTKKAQPEKTLLSHKQQAEPDYTALTTNHSKNSRLQKQTTVSLGKTNRHTATNNTVKTTGGFKTTEQYAVKNNASGNESTSLQPANNEGQRDFYIIANKKYLTGLPASWQNESMTLIGDDGKQFKVKTKPPVFRYSLGATAGITASAIGEVIVSSGPERKPLFYNGPSYTAGITQDFLFINRIAITTSFVFSQTGFKINNPQVDGNYNPAPLSYTCNINELDIPIGIKVYPVFKPNIRFYINTGIINHIRLKETFNYTFGSVDTPLTATLYVPADVYPTRTNFSGGGTTTNFSSVSGTPFTNSSMFSVNGNKRYYASYYFNAGVEGVIKQHLVLFAEPTFFLGLSSIGIQERRKYNVGANVGFRYAF